MASNKYPSKVLKLGRLPISYPHLDKPQAYSDEQTPKFDISILFKKTDPYAMRQWKQVRKAERELIEAAFPEGVRILKWYRGDGDTDKVNEETGETKKPQPGYFWLKGKAIKRPPLFDRDENRIQYDDPRLEGGMICNFIMALYKPKPPPGKKLKPMLACAVNGIQVLGIGKPFGGGATEKDFEDFDNDDLPDENVSDDDDDDDRPKKRGKGRKSRDEDDDEDEDDEDLGLDD